MRKPSTLMLTTALLASLCSAAVATPAVAGPPAPATLLATAVTGKSAPGPLQVDLTEGSNPILSRDVNLNQPQLRTKALDALRLLRGEMYDQNVWYNGKPLQDYLREKGVTSRQQYQDAVVWNSRMERIAIQRNVESLVRRSHTRPDGSGPFSACYMLDCSNGEVLAWGYKGIEDSILQGWGRGEMEALNKAKGEFNHDNGHLHLLLDPTRNAWGFAEFDGAATGQAGDRTSDFPDSTGLSGTNTLYLAAPTEALPSFKVSGQTDIHQGDQHTYTVTSSLTQQGYSFHGTFSSSDPQVLRISADGRATAQAVGKATVTAESNGARFTMEVNVHAGSMEGWLQEGAHWYWVESGNRATGWRAVNGAWYFFDPTTAAMRTGWVNDGGTWYYLRSNGAMATGWVNDGGTWYYLRPNGAMATGWVNDGGTWYYLHSNGAMATGWLNDGGTWYYLRPNGAMATGWLNDGGTWYYLHGNGAMATGTVTIDGRRSRFAPSGAWLGYA